MSSNNIKFHFTYSFKLPLNEGITKACLGKVIIDEGRTIEQINYIFLDKEAILQMNRDYLDHDFETDIITFDLGDDSSDGIMCDIYLCPDVIKENSIDLDTDFDEELYRVMVHGILHCLGYNDITD